MHEQNINFIENDIQALLYIDAEVESIEHLSIQNEEVSPSHLQPAQDFLDYFLDQDPLPHSSTHLDSLAPSPTSEDEDNNRSLPKKKKLKKRKKSMIDDNSPFHNCQKHLNNALKHILILPDGEQEAKEETCSLARQIWARFGESEIKTKRILHSVFNQKNEYKLNEAELSTYGLLELYQKYGAQAYNSAKTYLSKLAIDQLDNLTISCYVNSTKIRDKNNFKQYVQHFRQELENGYLKRRVVLENQ